MRKTLSLILIFATSFVVTYSRSAIVRVPTTLLQNDHGLLPMIAALGLFAVITLTPSGRAMLAAIARIGAKLSLILMHIVPLVVALLTVTTAFVFALAGGRPTPGRRRRF